MVAGAKANCVEDNNNITKVLSVCASKQNNSSVAINQSDLDFLENFDLENQINYQDGHITENAENSLKQHSIAYIASSVEKTVLKILNNQGQKRCSACTQIFLENDITDDSFTEYKSKVNDIRPPCKSTIDLMNAVDKLLNKYRSQDISFITTITHIMQKLDKDRFYEKSSFEQHNHKHEFIELVIKTYMNIKSRETCKRITRLSQKTKIRHSNLKEIHRAGQ